MSTVRIPLWDFKVPNTEALNSRAHINIELQETKELQEFYQGELLRNISQTVEVYIQEFFQNNFQDIKKSPAVFLLYNEFFIYEMIKNSFDAHASSAHTFIHEEEDMVITTYIDDGDGLINDEKCINYFTTPLYYESKVLQEPPPPLTPYFFVDSENCLPYLKLVDPKFDIHRPEEEGNVLLETKLTSEKKISVTHEKNHAGGKGEGLKKIAIFAYSVGGIFLMMDVKDLKKSNTYLKMAGIKDVSLLPETGVVFILNLPKFSRQFNKTFHPSLIKRILNKKSIEYDYFVRLNPRAKEKLNKIRPPRINIKMIPNDDEGNAHLYATSDSNSQNNSPTLPRLTTSSRSLSFIIVKSRKTPSHISSMSSPTSRVPSQTSSPKSPHYKSIHSSSSPTSLGTSRTNSSTSSPTSKSTSRSISFAETPNSRMSPRFSSSASSPISILSRSVSAAGTPTPNVSSSPSSDESDTFPEEVQSISITFETSSVSSQGFFAHKETAVPMQALSIDVSSPMAPISPDRLLSPTSDASPASTNRSDETQTEVESTLSPKKLQG